MNQFGQHIIEGLAGKLSLEDKSVEELEMLVSQHPYFGFAHLLLANKLKESNNETLAKQLQKTALYFYNPLWLNYLIAENKTTKPDEEKTEVPVIVNKEPVEITAENITKENAGIDEDDYLPDGAEAENDTAITGKLSKLIEQHLSEFKKPVLGNEEVIEKRNPFHTIDYFASQGIKFMAGQQAPDALGQKVKSFTEWLKQMKRVNEQPTDLGTDAETERIIEAIAQTSNETKDVITETMARVLAKQGKTDKAIQLYQKLSFLYPAKSTYFATQIQELKAK